MESWRQTWRTGFAPHLSTEGLQALAAGLGGGDGRLQQGMTTTPPPLQCHADSVCRGACPIGFVGLATGKRTVGEVEEFFANACYQADRACGQPTACLWFLNWVDDTPWEQVKRELLAEVQLSIAGRLGAAA